MLHSFKRRILLFAGYGQLAKGFGWETLVGQHWLYATLAVGNIGWVILVGHYWAITFEGGNSPCNFTHCTRNKEGLSQDFWLR